MTGPPCSHYRECRPKGVSCSWRQWTNVTTVTGEAATEFAPIGIGVAVALLVIAHIGAVIVSLYHMIANRWVKPVVEEHIAQAGRKAARRAALRDGKKAAWRGGRRAEKKAAPKPSPRCKPGSSARTKPRPKVYPSTSRCRAENHSAERSRVVTGAVIVSLYHMIANRWVKPVVEEHIAQGREEGRTEGRAEVRAELEPVIEKLQDEIRQLRNGHAAP